MRRRRRMVRRYDPDVPVSATALESILDAGLRVPSAGFTQAVSLLVLTGGDTDTFWAVTTDAGAEPDRWLAGIRTAPALVLMWTEPGAYLDRYAEPDKGWTDRDPRRWTAPYWYVDAGMTALAMLYAAVDHGLGACFFGAPPDRIPAIRRSYGVPDGHELVGIVSLGKPSEGRRKSRRGRRSAAELVHRGRWGSETKVIP